MINRRFDSVFRISDLVKRFITLDDPRDYLDRFFFVDESCEACPDSLLTVNFDRLAELSGLGLAAGHSRICDSVAFRMPSLS